ncbi:FkbM family methyltransferase [uncultured Ruegeria sp.]|uniref:FkbM family methyltransferase n=1 Tax=uncultured Ruegeria sp. TaxID=259304 RepID=UPI0026108901|nr:FkbM family methyltransferase [uncultured Ruegeria sp.]
MNYPQETLSNEERLALGLRCRDADCVPKVADAGKVYQDTQGRELQIMHNGLRVLNGGYYGDWMSNLIKLSDGHHEPQEERLFHEVDKCLSDTARMIELGGFWSYYSLWFLQHQPKRRSVVLEPEPEHLEVGRINAALNGLEPIFKAGFAGPEHIPSASFQGERSGPMQIPGYSVNHLMKEQRWDRLELLHCDIQGHEVAVLESCRKLFIAGKVDWVFVSTHAHQISGDPLTHQKCLQILQECGAFIEAEHDVHESFSGDGLIVARFGPPPRDWQRVTLSHNRHSTSLFRSLAYDLAENQQTLAHLEAHPRSNDAAATVQHESLAKRGTLYELTADGPLGPAGSTLLLRDDAVMSPEIVKEAAWEYDNIGAFAARCQPGKSYTLVDIGSNIGLFSRQLAFEVPQIARLLCVEPDEKNFQALQYNLGPLGDRASLFNVALGDTDATQEFFRDSENIGNYSLNPDAMRARSFDRVEVTTRETAAWMQTHLGSTEAIVWKSDTQGFDELIISRTPMEIWERIDVALIEIWRIAKPDFDAEAFMQRLSVFPNRKLGTRTDVSVDAVMDYLTGDDWEFEELLLWR